MIPDNRIAESITDGQSFRMNVHCSSALNEHGVRRGAVRRCDRTIPGNVTCPAWLDSYCPPLADDARTP
jgi:hypothetical protein